MPRHVTHRHVHEWLALALVVLAVTVAGVTPPPAGTGSPAGTRVLSSTSNNELSLASDASTRVGANHVHPHRCGGHEQVAIRFVMDSAPRAQTAAAHGDGNGPRAAGVGVVRGARQVAPGGSTGAGAQQQQPGAGGGVSTAGGCTGDGGHCVLGTPPAHVAHPDEPAWLAFDLGRAVTVAHIALTYSTGASQCPMGVQLQTADSHSGPWETAVSLAGGCGSELMDASTASASVMELGVPPGYTSQFWNVSVAGDGRWLGAAEGAAGSEPAELVAAVFVGCDACQPCGSGFYASGSCGSRGQDCARCSEGGCGAGWFEAQPCTGTSDRVCAPCSDACPDGHFAFGECSSYDDAMCVPCPAAGERIFGDANDAVVSAACEGSGSRVPSPAARSLAVHCATGQWEVCDGATCVCQPCTVCPESMDQVAECTIAANTVCQGS